MAVGVQMFVGEGKKRTTASHGRRPCDAGVFIQR